MFSSSADKTIKMWDLSFSSGVSTFEGQSDEVTSVCVSPDGRVLFVSSNYSTIGLMMNYIVGALLCVELFVEPLNI